MFAKMRSPVTITATELDNYLARGWFRMRQNVFTTNFLQFDNQFYSAIWLRVPLAVPVFSKKEKTLRRLNAGFRVEIKKALITESHEILYQAYRNAISFEVSGTLRELLLGNESYNRFDTYEITVYDGDILIALGVFDLGKKSAAGISVIYHPAYKKYSLGKFLIFLKIDFCRQLQMKFFYPGYLVPGYTAFDYKKEIGSDMLEYLHLGSQEWLPFANFNLSDSPLHSMIDKLEVLKTFLEQSGISTTLLFYKFFDANLDAGFYGNDLFDFPVFLYCFPTMGSFEYHLIVFDVRDECYYLLLCSSIIHLDYYAGNDNIFSSGLLKSDKCIISTKNPAEISAILPAYL